MLSCLHQVLLCYGTYTNLELLEHYGFLLNENPNDKVYIHLEPIVYSSTSWSKESLYVHHDGKPSFALLSMLRLWPTPQNKRRSVVAYSGHQLSADNEIFVMKWLSDACNTVLKNLPTSIDGDAILLNAIDNSQDLISFLEPSKILSSRDEVSAVLEANNLLNADNILVARKARRFTEKWKLAVQWRLRHKKVLVDCITYCNQRLDFLLT